MSASEKQMRIILRHLQENTALIWSRRILEKQKQKILILKNNRQKNEE